MLLLLIYANFNSCLYSLVFDLAMEFLEQVIYFTWENPLRYSIRVPQIFPGQRAGKTEAGQDWRWAKTNMQHCKNVWCPSRLI